MEQDKEDGERFPKNPVNPVNPVKMKKRSSSKKIAWTLDFFARTV
jgi:hypothetical protein